MQNLEIALSEKQKGSTYPLLFSNWITLFKLGAFYRKRVFKCVRLSKGVACAFLIQAELEKKAEIRKAPKAL